MKKALAFDTAASKRRYDENNYLHVEDNVLTLPQIADYVGREIVNWEQHGLDPNKLYRLLRPVEELEKAAHTFNGVPVLLKHKYFDPKNPPKDVQVGCIGTDARFDGSGIIATLTLHDQAGIDAVESEEQKELSASYTFDPVLTPGTWEGQEYDGIQANLHGNHVALVKVGRAGPRAAVSDSAENIQTHKDGIMKKILNSKAVTAIATALRGSKALAMDEAVPVQEVEKVVEEVLGEAVEAVVAEVQAAAEPAAAALDGEGETGTPASGEKDPLAQDEGPEGKLAELLAPLLEGKTDVGGKPIADWLAEVSAALGLGAAVAQDNEGEKAQAQDSDTKPAVAMDEAGIASRITRAITEQFKAKEQALEEVRPLVGSLRAVAFDSAEAVYAYALKQQNLNPKDYGPTALRGVVKGLVDARGIASGRPVAMDEAPKMPEGVDFSNWEVQ